MIIYSNNLNISNDISQGLDFLPEDLTTLIKSFLMEKRPRVYFDEIHEFFEVYEKIKNIRISMVLSHARSLVKGTSLYTRLPSEKYNELNYDISHLKKSTRYFLRNRMNIIRYLLEKYDVF